MTTENTAGEGLQPRTEPTAPPFNPADKEQNWREYRTAPPLNATVLTVKARLQGRDKHEFLALRDFYGVSEKRLAAAAIRFFLDSVKSELPKVANL